MTTVHAPPRSLGAVAPKIGNLIRRLGTTFDGEIVATVLALRRTLESEGLDLHDLADAIEAKESPPEPRPRGDSPLWAALSRSGRIAWLQAVLHEADLSDWEFRFLADIHRNSTLFDNWRLTAKQIAQLDRILLNAWSAGVRA